MSPYALDADSRHTLDIIFWWINLAYWMLIIFGTARNIFVAKRDDQVPPSRTAFIAVSVTLATLFIVSWAYVNPHLSTRSHVADKR